VAVRKRLAPHAVELVERNGLQPHPVVPVPSFNNVYIPMYEGFVNVLDLDLWAENHRIQLHVQEFREHEGREPDANEVMKLVQGQLPLASLEDRDPFKIIPLARSVARKGVERPPILTWFGEPKDGNRRIAAARYVVEHPTEFSPDERERGQWIKVWRAPKETTDDQFEALVVALNFEEDHKQEWPEYIKARLVYDRYQTLRNGVQGQVSPSLDQDLKKQVAKLFTITHPEVTRYIRMVQWAEEFENFHTAERGVDPAEVRYKADDIFQWFYEIQAGRGPEKLTDALDRDDKLKQVVYDLMYHVLDSGAQLRNLHKVVKDEAALRLLQQAHEHWDVTRTKEGKRDALNLVEAAIAEASKNAPSKKIGFEMFVKSVVDRFGSAAPDQWHAVDRSLLLQLARVLPGTLGAVQGELATRGVELGSDVT
jgi:predicted transcriptional regulator